MVAAMSHRISSRTAGSKDFSMTLRFRVRPSEPVPCSAAFRRTVRGKNVLVGNDVVIRATNHPAFHERKRAKLPRQKRVFAKIFLDASSGSRATSALARESMSTRLRAASAAMAAPVFFASSDQVVARIDAF